MMAVFYGMLVCWIVTMFAWQYREKQHAVERLEMLKLYRAQSLTDYSSQSVPTPSTQNFMKSSIKRAYENHHLLGDDDD